MIDVFFFVFKNINNDSDEENSSIESENDHEDEENKTPLSNTESSKEFIRRKQKKTDFYI